MSAKIEPHYADAKGVIVEGFDGNAIICNGAATPTDGLPGFAPGCLWFKRGGTVGAALYVNEGSATSTTWLPLKTQV